MQEGLKELETLLDPYDWFYEVCAEARRYVVYVTYMNSAQDSIIPDFVQGHQIVIHFASSAPGAKNEYLNKPQLNTYHHENLLPKEDWDTRLLQLKNIELPNLNILCCELDSLEKQCGSNILGEIFFEEHDRENAVTNLSQRYPEVRKKMHELYEKFGFELLYNELEL